MKVILILTALSLSSAMAQFGWDDEPDVGSVQTALDEFDTALRTPVIEPIRPIRPVIEPISVGCEATRLRSPISGLRPPAVPVVPWSRSPLVRAEEALVEQCDLEPEVAQVYRASGIDDSTRDPLPATSYGRSAVLSDSTRHSPQVTRHSGFASYDTQTPSSLRFQPSSFSS